MRKRKKWILSIESGYWILKKYENGKWNIDSKGMVRPGEVIPLPKGCSPKDVIIRNRKD